MLVGMAAAIGAMGPKKSNTIEIHRARDESHGIDRILARILEAGSGPSSASPPAAGWPSWKSARVARSNRPHQVRRRKLRYGVLNAKARRIASR